VELDALPPAALEELIRRSIENRLDMSKFRKEQELQEGEMSQLQDLKDDVHQFIEENHS